MLVTRQDLLDTRLLGSPDARNFLLHLAWTLRRVEHFQHHPITASRSRPGIAHQETNFGPNDPVSDQL